VRVLRTNHIGSRRIVRTNHIGSTGCAVRRDCIVVGYLAAAAVAEVVVVVVVGEAVVVVAVAQEVSDLMRIQLVDIEVVLALVPDLEVHSGAAAVNVAARSFQDVYHQKAEAYPVPGVALLEIELALVGCLELVGEGPTFHFEDSHLVAFRQGACPNLVLVVGLFAADTVVVVVDRLVVAVHPAPVAPQPVAEPHSFAAATVAAAAQS
jgi:hypothetical protein